MEESPRSRFAGRLEEKHDEDRAGPSDFWRLAEIFGWNVLPAILGAFAVVYLILKTMAIQAPFLFTGVVTLSIAAVVVGWRTVQPNRKRLRTPLDS